ncbi:MAG: hypothetical protein ACI9BD_000010 [Candidatus Marinamargulisbacteria bacterium]|jgi:hypothetical protein
MLTTLWQTILLITAFSFVLLSMSMIKSVFQINRDKRRKRDASELQNLLGLFISKGIPKSTTNVNPLSKYNIISTSRIFYVFFQSCRGRQTEILIDLLKTYKLMPRIIDFIQVYHPIQEKKWAYLVAGYASQPKTHSLLVNRLQFASSFEEKAIILYALSLETQANYSKQIVSFINKDKTIPSTLLAMYLKSKIESMSSAQISPLLKSTDPRIRTAMCRAARYIRDTSKLSQIEAMACKDTDKYVRLEALNSLIILNVPLSETTISELLKSEDPRLLKNIFSPKNQTHAPISKGLPPSHKPSELGNCQTRR